MSVFVLVFNVRVSIWTNARFKFRVSARARVSVKVRVRGRAGGRG